MSYYSDSLSAGRLKKCYEIAPPRVVQYLAAEVRYVLDHIRATDRVLELGCGYGRVLHGLLPAGAVLVGIDISYPSLAMAHRELPVLSSLDLATMDAFSLAIRPQTFDVVVCIQNGLSAFGRDPRRLVNEAVRVTRHGGTCLFSTYSPRFWEHRLEWFVRQSDHGLIGPIDWSRTHEGVVVCKDGFVSRTLPVEELEEIGTSTGQPFEIVEVDMSSMFLRLRVH